MFEKKISKKTIRKQTKLDDNTFFSKPNHHQIYY